jgi:hypothetical protein
LPYPQCSAPKVLPVANLSLRSTVDTALEILRQSRIHSGYMGVTRTYFVTRLRPEVGLSRPTRSSATPEVRLGYQELSRCRILLYFVQRLCCSGSQSLHSEHHRGQTKSIHWPSTETPQYCRLTPMFFTVSIQVQRVLPLRSRRHHPRRFNNLKPIYWAI